jgi:Cu/Ag efflux protein CusF
MKKQLAVTVATLIALAAGGTALAEEKAPAEKAPAEKSSAKKPSVKKERTVTATAIVQAIDLEKRVVTLKNPEGKVFDVTVGPEARNLPQVKVGDEVTVKYYEALSAKVYKKGEAPQVEGVTEGLARAKEGEKPAGIAGRKTTVTASVEAIDMKKPTVTLKGPEGKSVTVKVKDRKNLENVKVGDEVVLTYTEAIAISVEKAKK